MNLYLYADSLFRYKQTNPGGFKLQTFRKLHVINTKKQASVIFYYIKLENYELYRYSFRSQYLYSMLEQTILTVLKK